MSRLIAVLGLFVVLAIFFANGEGNSEDKGGDGDDEMFASLNNVVDETVDDLAELVLRKELPDFWEPENDPAAIKQKRDKLLEEVLGQKEYAQMRKVLDALKKKESARTVNKTPDNVMIDVALMEQVNALRVDSDDPTILQFVPSLSQVNRPIGDMLFQGDVLLSEHQANELLDEMQESNNGTTNGTTLVLAGADEHLHAPKGKSRRRRQVQKGRMYPYNKWSTSQPISFTFDASINEHTRDLVRQAAQFWQDHTCVSFQENGPGRPQVRVFKGQGCYSNIGRNYNARSQEMSLGSGCEVFGTITHEFGHVLGLFHHHARQDRDNNIQIVEENIEPGWMDQYRKETSDRSDLEGLPYDYGSNMHYGGTSSDGQKIIMAARNKRYQHTMGNNIGPMFLDLEAINKFYGCESRCPSGIDCKNDGFRNPRDCQKCICPNGFGGDDCSEREESKFGADDSCGQSLTASADSATLSGSVTPKLETGRLLSDRHAACHFHIDAPAGSRVQIELKSVNGTCTPECYFGAIEIKLGDFQKGGIRVCCQKHLAELGDKFVSDGEKAIVSVYSQRGERSFSLDYKTTTEVATKDDVLGGGSASKGDSTTSNLLNTINGILSDNSRETCSDNSTICKGNARRMVCQVRSWARQLCQKTCNQCQ